MNRIFQGFALLGVLVLVGAGCAVPNPFENGSAPDAGSASKSVVAAEALQFVPGDSFEIRQTFLGLGGFLPDLFKNKKGVRNVTVKRFAPTHAAELDWNILLEEETAASKQARADFEKQASDGNAIPPEIQLETRTASGTVRDINLHDPHAALLPAYWKEGETSADNVRSGIWLSDDAFQELSRTGKTILNLGIFDSSINTIMKSASDLQSAYATLKNKAAEDGQFHDLTLLQADPDPIEYPLTVNGSKRMVSAWKVRNWFGELIVLNSRQNPMILKMTMNPLFAGATEMFGGGTTALNGVFGYEVDNLELHYLQDQKTTVN